MPHRPAVARGGCSLLEFFRGGLGPVIKPANMTQTIVIVGASHASVQAIDTLRREGHAGPIVLVGDEPHLPYNRPPL